MPFRYAITSVIALAFFAHSAGAQSVDTVSVTHIEEVSVTTSIRRATATGEQRLAADELTALSVYSIADAVRYFSGIQIKEYGGVGGLKTVNIRSLGSQHVGVFYDGVQLGNAQNGTVDLGRFSLDNVESVSIYSGNKSAIFQSAKEFASANTIYIRTRKPTFDERSYNLNLGAKVGSFDRYNPSVLWEQKITDKVSYSLSSEWLTTSGEYPFRRAKVDGYDTIQVRQNGDVEALRAEVGVWGELEQGAWSAKLYLYDSERGYPGAVVRGSSTTFRNEDRQWDNNIFLQTSIDQHFSEVYSLRLSGKLSHDYLRYLSDTEQDITTVHTDNSYYQKEGYFSAAHLVSFGSFALSYATDLQVNSLNSNMLNFVYPTRYLLLNGAAAMLSREQFTLQANILHTYNYDTTKSGMAAESRSIFSPTVHLTATPFKDINLSLRALYKDIFRLPTFNDLYYTTVGNAYLSPERTKQYSLGLNYLYEPQSCTLQNLELQVDSYFNQVKDKIVAMPTSNQFRWTMTNLGYVEILGIESTLSSKIETKIGGKSNNENKSNVLQISPRLSYTFQRAAELTNPESDYYGGQIPYTPRHSATAVMALSYNSISLNYSFLYTGERFTSTANIIENYVEPWYTHDLSVGYTFSLLRCTLRTTFEVNNLLNQPYEVVLNYPMPGRNYCFKLNFIL